MHVPVPRNHLPDLALLAIALILHAYALLRGRGFSLGARLLPLLLSACWITFSILTSLTSIYQTLPSGDWLVWTRGIGYLWAMASSGVLAVYLSLRSLEPRFSTDRRQFFRVAQGALLASPAIITGYGVLSGRKQFHLKQIDLPIRGLAKDLEGLRIVHISDIHLSPFLTESELERVIDMANETRAHLAVVTGDLITGRHDPLERSIYQVSRLKTDAGILGCNGNHEIFAGAEEQALQLGARRGFRILRRENEVLSFGSARLNVVGVDYQPMHSNYLPGMDRFVQPGALNLLLSHNPDVFPVAARCGYQLMLSGHTHGGQVTFEILHQYANVARFFTPYVYGRYQQDGAALYVTRGIGTVGIPARVGAPPEIALVRLCAG